MSQALFPTLPGLTYGVTKSPTWSTRVQTAVSGKELRAAFWMLPRWKYQLQYEFLRSSQTWIELQTLLDFYNARQGMFGTFLFTDPDDNSVTAMPFGTGDGVKTAFQLSRTLISSGFAESIYNPISAGFQIFKNGALLTGGGTDYTLNITTGVVTFTVAPAAAAALTWTGSFYWRVRFDIDALETAKFMNLLWEAKKVNLITIKGS